MMYSRVPRSRVAVLIGKSGKVKREIEERAGVHINVDSGSGDVTINESDAPDITLVLKAKSVVEAIGYGFSPEKAMSLFSDDVYLDVIDMREYSKTEKRLKILKGRVIGRRGRTREMIEDISGAYLSVFENTVGIIGDVHEMEAARKAIEMLLTGSKHATIYRFLEKRRQELQSLELEAYLGEG